MWVATMNLVLRFSPTKPETQTPFAGVGELAPNDIDVAGSLIVVADGGQERARIVTLTTAGSEKDFSTDGGAQGVAGGPGGQIAYSQQVPKSGKPEQVGLISPPNPAQAFEQLGDPFGVALGADKAFWVVRFMDGELTRMTTNGERTSLGGLPKESARQIAPGPGNTLWVTLTKSEHEAVARVSGLEPPVEKGASVPQTRITKRPKHTVRTAGKRATVKFRFASTVQGSSFECALTKLRKGKKPPKPVFKSCKSPQSYSLKPGRYRFKVRAVASGKVDPSPAFGTFVVVHVAKHKQ
jgi:hypothetical protein